jgi:hypothetical protein
LLLSSSTELQKLAKVVSDYLWHQLWLICATLRLLQRSTQQRFAIAFIFRHWLDEVLEDEKSPSFRDALALLYVSWKSKLSSRLHISGHRHIEV